MASIPTCISRAARWFDTAVAVDDGRRTITFREVNDRSNRLANAFAQMSPGRSGRVAVLAGNRAELVEVDFAIAKAGKIRVPLNTRLTEDECRYVIADSGADILVTETDYVERAVTWLGDVDTLRRVIVMGAAGPSGLEYEGVLSQARGQAAAVETSADEGSFILYTSGTTGRPKGALSTVGGRLAATFAMLRDELVVPVDGGMIHAGSMAHGSGSKTLAYFLRGARNLPMAKWDPDEFLATVSTKHATGSFVVPTMLTSLVDAARTGEYDLSSLCSLSYGGAPIAPGQLSEAIAAFPGALVQVYGSCEAPHPVLVFGREDHADRRGISSGVTSVGREALHCEVRLVTTEGSDAEDGELGELWIRGQNVMAGYWGNPQATAEALVDGWYRSGDVARRDDDGYFYIVDRVRDVIITGGLNVYPAEVENAIHQVPGVREVAVVGVPNEEWGEEVKAYVVMDAGVVATPDQVIDHCRTVLAGYKKPRHVEFVQDLPHGSTGKVLKRELRDKHWVGRERSV